MTFKQFVKCCIDSFTMLQVTESMPLLFVDYNISARKLWLAHHSGINLYYMYPSLHNSTNDLFDEFAKFEDALLKLI